MPASPHVGEPDVGDHEFHDGTGRRGTFAPRALAYTASKHAVVGLMRAYANLLAPHGIRVNTVHPTGVATPMVLNPAMQEYLESIGTKSGGGNALPVAMIEAADVSNAIAWLVGRRSVRDRDDGPR